MNQEKEVPIERELREIAGLDGISPLKRYIQSLPHYVSTTLEEDISLGRKVEKWLTAEENGETKEIEQIRLEGKEAKKKLIESCLLLVVSRAVKRMGNDVDIMDLIGAGNEGLTQAVEKYKPELGFRFNTLALYWIDRGIKNEIHINSRGLYFSQHMHDRMKKINAIQGRMINEGMGEKPDRARLMEEMGIGEITMKNTEDALRIKYVSLDKKIEEYNEKSSTVGDEIADERAFVEPKIDSDNIRTEFNRLVNKLPPRLELILRLLSGMGTTLERDTEPLREIDIANKMGISRERVNQLVRQAKIRIVKNGDLPALQNLKDYLKT
jgi:RNA polymerase sigma factor (sigma-70 family)